MPRFVYCGRTRPPARISAIPPNVEILESRDGAHVILDVHGEIDLATAPQLQSHLEAVNVGQQVVVDLSNVTFMDSTGLRVLITGHEAAAAAGGTLSIVVTEGPVTKLLSITGVDEWLDVHPTRPSATGDHRP